mmetsp:Transcript_82768/g.167884  ORF Transcript_82768/g.167884 Transcript_82768/m.167884 type:complete len:95 (-) Transcript_82768:1074-1358(-)
MLGQGFSTKCTTPTGSRSLGKSFKLSTEAKDFNLTLASGSLKSILLWLSQGNVDANFDRTQVDSDKIYFSCDLDSELEDFLIYLRSSRFLPTKL